MTEDWNASLYLRFERERTQPSRDLLASVHKYLRISDLCKELALLLKPRAGKVA